MAGINSIDRQIARDDQFGSWRPHHRRRPAPRPAPITAACAGWTPRLLEQRRHRRADEEHHARPLAQQELQEKGGADFAIEFTDGVRFRVAIFRQRGNIGMVLRRIPEPASWRFEQIGMPRRHQTADRSAARSLILVTGPTRLGQDHQSGVDDQLSSTRTTTAISSPSKTRSSIFTSTKKCTVNQPRDRRGRARLQGRHPPGLAYGPRHRAGRRNARHGDDPRRHRGRRDRPHRLRHAAHRRHTPLINRIIDVFPKEQQEQVHYPVGHRPHQRVVRRACCRAQAPRAWSPPTR